jgi:hypothetical protein
MQSQSQSDAIMDIYEKIEEKQVRDCNQLKQHASHASHDETYEIRDPHHLINLLKSMRSRL